ncbi:uncharacterized protein C5orf34 homolog [Styela clava]|uniref:uncharacterized protein C5orf34 homolog n=1 Tax=Styela clava TaxID=7725 RepID=UPI00193ABDD5|nr:uncharacterized protein C5orf34 homolog [Styela clava]
MLSLPLCQASANVDLKNIFQIISFEDDSLEILFRDQSVLQLSPCGANFRYTRPHGQNQPSLAQNLNEVCQRCIFATSETRSKVIQAISIRNQLSSCPYLPSDLLEHMGVDSFRFHRKIGTYEWPQVLSFNTEDTKAINKQVVFNNDGSITVKSVDNFAQLDLFPDGHRIRISFVVPLSENDKVNHKFESQQDIESSQSSSQNIYVWQTRIFPVFNCPTEWQYPLELALHAKYGTRHEKWKSRDNRSLAVASVSRICEGQFRHKWRNVISCSSKDIQPMNKDNGNEISLYETHFSSGNSVIKFMWCENASYWMSSKLNDQQSKVEVWFANGDVFKSHPLNDRYFIHVYPSLHNSSSCSKEYLYTNGKFVEKIISSASVPAQNSILKSIMLRCIRMLLNRQQEVANFAGMDNDTPCWNSNKHEELRHASFSLDDVEKVSINEKVHITGVGKFSVADDSIQIAFDDGSVLHMTIDIGQLRKSGQHYANLFIPGQCRIMLATGKYFVIEKLDKPQEEVEEYMKHAAAWLEWLSKPVQERTEASFYSDTIYNIENVDMVSQELAKINRLTLTSTPQYLELSENHSVEKKGKFTECSNFQDVSRALSHTSKAITDLENIIGSFRKSS